MLSLLPQQGQEDQECHRLRASDSVILLKRTMPSVLFEVILLEQQEAHPKVAEGKTVEAETSA